MHDCPGSDDLASLETVLANHLKWLQADYEGSLRQKAKLRWIALGDDNTAFFHRSISHRARNNRITFLHVNGEDIFDTDRIQNAFYDHFSSIFTTVPQFRASVNIDIAQNGLILSFQQGKLLDLSFLMMRSRMLCGVSRMTKLRGWMGLIVSFIRLPGM